MRERALKVFTQYLLKSFTTIAIYFGLTLHSFANTNQISAICDVAAQKISVESGVPLNVLRAISLTETGRVQEGSLQPWPWTVNMEGVGKWFKTYNDAKAYVDDNFARGARSFDVGCFQINYRWHHQAFTSVEHMFEPMANARYAAKFLSQLYDEFGSWPRAAGAYHSRTPKYAKKYVARFNRIRKNLEPIALPVELAENQPDTPKEPTLRVNSFPLLQRGHRGQMASLVPLGQSSGARLIDISNTSARPVD